MTDLVENECDLRHICEKKIFSGHGMFFEPIRGFREVQAVRLAYVGNFCEPLSGENGCCHAGGDAPFKTRLAAA